MDIEQTWNAALDLYLNTGSTGEVHEYINAKYDRGTPQYQLLTGRFRKFLNYEPVPMYDEIKHKLQLLEDEN